MVNFFLDPQKVAFGDSLKIKLGDKVPSLQASELSYVILHDKHMYLIRLAAEVFISFCCNHVNINFFYSFQSGHFTDVLRKQSAFYEPVVETPKELVGILVSFLLAICKY